MKVYQVVGLWILCLLVVAPIVGSQPVSDATQAVSVEKRIEFQMERMTKRLGLTSEQQTQIDALLKKNVEAIKSLQEQIRTLHEQMQREIESVLTDEQKTKFSESPRGFMAPRFGQEEFPIRPGRRGEEGPGFDRPGRRGEEGPGFESRGRRGEEGPGYESRGRRGEAGPRFGRETWNRSDENKTKFDRPCSQSECPCKMSDESMDKRGSGCGWAFRDEIERDSDTGTRRQHHGGFHPNYE